MATKVKLISDGVITPDQITLTTASTGTNTTAPATTAFVQQEISALVDSSPEALNTLNELAAALGDDANFSTTVTNSIAAKAPLASPTFTGTAEIPNLTIGGAQGTDGQLLTSTGSGIGWEDAPAGYTDSDVETYLDGGTSTPTFSTATVTGDLTVDTNTLYVDSTNNRVGIGIGDSAYMGGTLHIKTSQPVIRLQDSDSSTGYTTIEAFADGTLELATNHGDSTGDIKLTVNANNALFVESPSGNVGIGTSDPTAPLHVDTNTDNAYGIRLTGRTNNGSGVWTGIGIGGEIANTKSAIIFEDIGESYSRGKLLFCVNNDADQSSADPGDARLTIQNDGNVGIGTSSPSNYYSGADNLVVYQATGEVGMTIATGNSSVGALYFADGTTGADAYRGGMAYAHSTDVFTLVSGGAAKINIDATGHTYPNVNGSWDLGKTTNLFRNLYLSGSVSLGGNINATGVTTSVHTWKSTSNSTSASKHMIFANPNGNVGDIRTNGSATSYVTLSDYRLKENVEYDWDATTRLKQLRPSRFNFIADADTTVDGFLAHEVQDIVPEAISGVKDEMKEEEYEVTPAVLDEDGNVVTEAVMGTREVPEYQGIDQSKLVPLLTKALQEQQTLIESLEARITALES